LLLAYFQASFFEASVETNCEFLQTLQSLRFAEGSHVILNVFVQVEVELIPECRVVPGEVLLLGLKVRRIFRYRTGLFESSYLPIRGSSEVGVSVDTSQGFLERLPGTDFCWG